MSASDVKKPIYKNPYAIAFIAGIITITAIRPFTRHIPDPPPILSQGIPAFVAETDAGESFDYGQLKGRVHVAAIVSGSCQSNCLATLEAQRALHVSLTNNVKNAAVLTLVAPDAGRLVLDDQDAKPLTHYFPWVLAAMTRADNGGDWAHFYGEASLTSAVHNCLTPKLVLIDRHGRIRGSYDIGEWGVDETFYRTTHVLDESLNSPETHMENTKD